MMFTKSVYKISFVTETFFYGRGIGPPYRRHLARKRVVEALRLRAGLGLLVKQVKWTNHKLKLGSSSEWGDFVALVVQSR